MNRSSLTVAIFAAVTWVQPAATAQQGGPHPPTRAERFVESPGKMELRGVLTARPLQPEDAAVYGLSAAEIEARRASAQALLSEFPLQRHHVEVDEYLIEVGLGNEQEAADFLMASGDFQYVTPDWLVSPAACPNDLFFLNQWHHAADKINSCAGWDLETGDPSIVVAICDTGLRTSHLDVQLHRQEGYNAVDQLWENQGGLVGDVYTLHSGGHGTGVTGLAAANGDNSTGVTGTGWNLGHRIMRVSNASNGFTPLSIINDASRLASDVGDKVVNVSYNGVKDPSVATTGTYVRNNGSLLVWAAGNNSPGTFLSGSTEDDIVVVGYTDANDVLGSQSNYGTFMDLVAPGEGVFTISKQGNNNYTTQTGTSFAAPLVSGLAGLIWSADPSLTPAEVETILRAGCDDLGAVGEDDDYGYGRIDVFQTLSLVGDCGTDNYCTSNANSTGVNAKMRNLGSASIAANDLVLLSTDCPPGQLGLFFFGDGTNNAPSGDGTVCVGGSVFRLPVVQVDGAGVATFVFDHGNLPAGAGPFSAGETTNFSYWFRDLTPGGWNFADGLSVQWCD